MLLAYGTPNMGGRTYRCLSPGQTRRVQLLSGGSELLNKMLAFDLQW